MPESEAAQPTSISISDQAIDQSQSFVGRWNHLISTTNWEKGEIICNWRRSLEENGAEVTEYSDEAWSQLVGGVTPQHVGRLRRTFERFGHVYQEYNGVYWSHFYAALDWDDPEMWLEGAIQNKWSVSKMRHQRWETLGKVAADQPEPGQIVATEMAEEIQSLDLTEAKRQNDRDVIEGPVHEGPDWGDAPSDSGKSQPATDTDPSNPKSETVRPFESFSELPDDVMDAASDFKVAIISHKADGWKEIAEQDMLALLDALKQLVTAPSA